MGSKMLPGLLHSVAKSVIFLTSAAEVDSHAGNDLELISCSESDDDQSLLDACQNVSGLNPSSGIQRHQNSSIPLSATLVSSKRQEMFWKLIFLLLSILLVGIV